MDARIAKAQLLVEQANHQPLSARDLAATVGMSEFHFNRCFKAETGTTAAAYIRVHRLRMAALRLEWMEESLEDVALLAGYQSLSAFSRAFKDQFGISPLRYRRGDNLQARRFDNGWQVAEDDRRSVRITVQPSRPFIRRRYLGPYSTAPKHWAHFIDLVPRDLKAPGAVYAGFIYDSPSNTLPEAIRYDCSILLPASAPMPTLAKELSKLGLVTGSIRQGLYCDIDHSGSYNRIGNTYSQLMDHWISSQTRYTFTDDPSLEVYEDPLLQQTDPESLRIKIYAPVTQMLFGDQVDPRLQVSSM